MNAKVKIVFHAMSSGDLEKEMYGEDGFLGKEYKKICDASDIDYEYVSFAGKYLDGYFLDIFLQECRDATIVILDAWNHPTNISWLNDKNFDPYTSMENVAEEIIKISNAQIFAQLLYGEKVAVHNKTIPIDNFLDRKIINSIISAKT